MRVQQHIIDSRGVKKALTLIPDHWVVRELSERDYGIDLLVEIFHQNNSDEPSDSAPTYEPSGHICHLQLKTTDIKVTVSRSGHVGQPFSIRALKYAERYATPLILLRVDVSSSSAKCYFTWIQRYIRDVLDVEEPKWRSKPPTANGNEATITIRIPEANIFEPPFTKLEFIAARIKYVEELVEFTETYGAIAKLIKSIGNGLSNAGDEQYDFILKGLTRIRNLRTLYDRNDCCIEAKSIETLIGIIIDVKNKVMKKSSLSSHPDKENLRLLQKEVSAIATIEDDIAKNSGGTVY